MLDDNYYKVNLRDLRKVNKAFAKFIVNKLPQPFNYIEVEQHLGDNELVRISTNNEYMEYYIKNALYNTSVCERFKQQWCDGVLVWAWLSSDVLTDTAFEFFGFHSGISIITIDINGYQAFYHFAILKNPITQKILNPQMSDSIMAHLSILHDFIKQYKSSIEQFLQDAPITSTQLSPPTATHKKKFGTIMQYINFIKNKKYIYDKFFTQPLTVKEVQVLILIEQGLLLQDVANIMKRSVQTLNTHIKNIRTKLTDGCKEIGASLAGLTVIADKSGICNIQLVDIQWILDGNIKK